jgi:hypothetical protein
MLPDIGLKNDVPHFCKKTAHRMEKNMETKN